MAGTELFFISVFFLEQKTGPYIAGTELSLADATVFPTLVFVTFMLPKFVDSWDAERLVMCVCVCVGGWVGGGGWGGQTSHGMV
jgi:hypothetical protein